MLSMCQIDDIYVKTRLINIKYIKHGIMSSESISDTIERDPIIINTEVEELSRQCTDAQATESDSNIFQIRKSNEREEQEGSDHASELTKSSSFCSAVGDLGADQDDADDLFHAEQIFQNDLQVFILSMAGKPIFKLNGNEDKFATYFGVMQALVSVVQDNNDSLRSITVGDTTFVFQIRSQLIFVAVSKSKKSVQQIQLQLNDVYNQIISTITLSTLNKVYETRKNFDLRRLLSGSERLIHHLLASDTKVSNIPFVFMTHSVRVLPMNSNTRDAIVSIIQTNCSKIKNLVFAILIAEGRLVTLVRMKKYVIHPADLRIIFNLVDSTEGFKSSENWTPICLPKFDPNGFLHAHISYLTEDCNACLLLMSTERDIFFDLQEAKKKITEKLIKSNHIESINEAIKCKGINPSALGLPEIRHFLYRCKSSAQLLCSDILPPYNTKESFERLEKMYFELHQGIHSNGRLLKLIFQARDKESLLVWVTQGYELFATFEPLVDKVTVIMLINKLLKWIKKEEDYLFILNAPSF